MCDTVVVSVPVGVAESVRERASLLLVHLNERQKRLWMASEARQIGHGGIAVVAQATGASRSRISQGVAELKAGAQQLDRVRRRGGGRKPATVTDPGLRDALLGLVEPTRRGDPTGPLSWTTLSTRKLAAELARVGHPTNPRTVAALLHQEGFSLQANTKTLEGGQHADRDAQFSYLDAQARAHQDADQPVISVDTKKKELVGPYKNGGREWCVRGEPTPVKVHDFVDSTLGKANPYGVYDVGANTGWVSVGTDHDTAAFAVATIRRWWDAVGRPTYPHATTLLITADGGGSNGYRVRQWKTELAKLAADTGLTITVCHLPPGTSKWNKIEHRLFAHISMNWRGRPLTSHDVIINTIAATTTTTGLTVHAELDDTTYPLGVKISDTDMNDLTTTGILQRHQWHPEWN